MVKDAQRRTREQAWAEAAGAVLAQVRSALDFEMAAVSRKTGDRYVVLLASDDVFGTAPGDQLVWADTFCARMADGRAPQVSPDVSLDPAYAEAAVLLSMPAAAYVSVPLRDERGELLGTLCAASPRRRDGSLHAQAAQVSVLAGVLAALLSSELRLAAQERRSDRDELQRLEGFTDATTGLGNRRLWDRQLAAEERRCAAFGLPAAVVSLDVDGLRGVNGTSGHDAGDGVLRCVAAALAEVAGPDDVVARVGGDQFALLLPECDDTRLAAVRASLAPALAERGVAASVGSAVRAAAGLAAAWEAADALRRDAKRRQRVAALTPLRPSPAGVAARRPADTDDVVLRELLELARRHLGAAIAFVGEWQGGPSGVRVMRALSSQVPVPVGPGSVEPLDDTLCQRILDGRLPHVIPDTAAEPAALALPITTALPIGSYVGVPVVLSDGQVYGTLCCLSPVADPALTDGAADFLSAIAESMARVLEAELRVRSAHTARVARLDPVLRGVGVRTVFQPVVSLADDHLVGVEALARFGPEPGNPARWFGDAQEAGLTADLELTTARLAVERAAALPGFLALNFSATTICTPGFRTLVDQVEPSRLVIEVSEHEQIHDYAAVRAALAPLRRRGLRVAVDDAGAGFASLRHVVLLAPDIIKLDISLVHGIDSDPTRQALAAALTTFARSTGAQVVAEGVETPQERATLAVAGVGLMQGWFSGPGVPAADLVTRYGTRPLLPAPRPDTVELPVSAPRAGRPRTPASRSGR